MVLRYFVKKSRMHFGWGFIRRQRHGVVDVASQAQPLVPRENMPRRRQEAKNTDLPNCHNRLDSSIRKKVGSW